jgi:serine/threonine-protein kinase RsbW
MRGSDCLKLDLTSDPAMLPEVRNSIREWCARRKWNAEQVADVVLAVDEALSNVIKHGYCGKPGCKIEFCATVVKDPQRGPAIEIRIRDYGKQVPIDSIRGRDLDDIRPGGLGVHIIKSVMCVVEYSHAEGGGMLLVMRKYRRPQSTAECPPTGKS